MKTATPPKEEQNDHQMQTVDEANAVQEIEFTDKSKAVDTRKESIAWWGDQYKGCFHWRWPGETCWEMSQLEIALQISIPPRQAAAVNVDIVRRITDWQWALWMGGGECKEINLSLDIPYWTMKDTYFQANIAFTTEKEYKHLLYRTGCLLLEELN